MTNNKPYHIKPEIKIASTKIVLASLIGLNNLFTLSFVLSNG